MCDERPIHVQIQSEYARAELGVTVRAHGYPPASVENTVIKTCRCSTLHGTVGLG